MLFSLICQIILSICCSQARKQDFTGYKVYRVYPDTKDHIHVLKTMEMDDPELDFWTQATIPGNPVDINVAPNKQIRFLYSLSRLLIRHELRIRDVGDLIKQEEPDDEPSFFSYNQYLYDYKKFNTYKDMIREMRDLTQLYPGRGTLQVIGITYEGRKIYALKIHQDPTRRKKIVFIDCGIHAREWIAPATCMYMINQLIALDQHYIEAVEALQKYDFIIVPVFNVDGYVHSQVSQRLWRKTRKPYGNCFGADPNRNWNFKWTLGVGTSDNPCSDIYRGPQPFSEVEVKTISRFMTSIKDSLAAYYNLHAYSQMWLTPWSFTEKKPQDWPEIERIAKVGVEAIKELYGTNYTYGQPAKILYGVSGGSIDWAYAVLGVKYSYALELRDTGKNGFLLPASQIIPTGRETLHAILAAVNAMTSQ